MSALAGMVMIVQLTVSVPSAASARSAGVQRSVTALERVSKLNVDTEADTEFKTGSSSYLLTAWFYCGRSAEI